MSVNVAQTVWAPNNGTGEFSVATPAFLVDPTSSAIFIVDPQAATNFVTDTGVTLTDIPATTWSEDDSR